MSSDAPRDPEQLQKHSQLSALCLIGLFSELDSQPSLGVVNYGVSMTTLEDVFLRLEAEAEVDQAGGCAELQRHGYIQDVSEPPLIT